MIAQLELSLFLLVEMDIITSQCIFLCGFFEYAYFDIQINGETICTAYGDRNNSDNQDFGHTSCSAATFATEG